MPKLTDFQFSELKLPIKLGMHKKMIDVVKDSFFEYLNSNRFVFSKEIDGGSWVYYFFDSSNSALSYKDFKKGVKKIYKMADVMEDCFELEKISDSNLNLTPAVGNKAVFDCIGVTIFLE
jgi:hypothetical protein